MNKTMKVYLGAVGWVTGIIVLIQSALWLVSIKGSWGDIAVLAGILLLIGAGALVLFGITKAGKLIDPPSNKDDSE